MEKGFNLHSLPFLVSSLLFFVLPSYIFWKNRKSVLVRRFFTVGLSAFLWQFPYFIGYNLQDAAKILVWYRLAYVGLVFIPPTLYHFIVSFLNLKRHKFIVLFYSIAVFFVFFIVKTTHIVSGIRQFPWGSSATAGSAYTPFLIVWVTPCILSLFYLYKEYRRADSPYHKKRIKFFLITLSIAYLATVDSYFVQGIKMYPFGFIPLIFFGITTTYAIFRYRLLDIEIVIKKVSLIIVGCIASVSLIYVTALYLQPFFYASLGTKWILFPVFLSFLVGFGLFHFIHFVRRMQETELSHRFAYRSILKREAQRISAARTMKEVLAYLVRDVSCLVRLDYMSVFIADVQQGYFILARDIARRNRGKKIPAHTRLTPAHLLVKEMLKKRRPLIRSELEYLMQTTAATEAEKKLFLGLLEEMRALNAEISIPGFCEGELMVIVNIGQKLNPAEIITGEDLEIFTSLLNAIARTLHDFMLQKEKTRLIVASQNTIISAIEAKDSSTRGHTERVAHYTSLIGKNLRALLRASPHDITALSWSAQLHDVGKIGIPDSILFKPEPLTEQETQAIRRHPLAGMKILGPVREWLGEDICLGILQHHENIDGSGYPSGLKGSDIHIFARIIRVADAFDSMTSDRPYRSALRRTTAFEELRRYAGTLFDPLVVQALYEVDALGQL